METLVLFFGKLRDAAGGGERRLHLPAEITDRASLVAWISAGDEILFDALSAPGVRLSVDQMMLEDQATFTSPQEIAFLPPFSGG